MLDAVTGLTGSGPAYLFLVAEALIDAGVLAGLTRPVAEALVRQLFVGSAAMLAECGDPVSLRAMVTSPGGTTAAGVRVLEEHGMRSAFLEAVMAATARSQELGARTDRSHQERSAAHASAISWCDSFLSCPRWSNLHQGQFDRRVILTRSRIRKDAPTGLVPSGGWHRPLSIFGPRRWPIRSAVLCCRQWAAATTPSRC